MKVLLSDIREEYSCLPKKELLAEAAEGDVADAAVASAPSSGKELTDLMFWEHASYSRSAAMVATVIGAAAAPEALLPGVSIPTQTRINRLN